MIKNKHFVNFKDATTTTLKYIDIIDHYFVLKVKIRKMKIVDLRRLKMKYKHKKVDKINQIDCDSISPKGWEIVNKYDIDYMVPVDEKIRCSVNWERNPEPKNILEFINVNKIEDDEF